MNARNSLPRHILAAALEGLAARHARVVAQIATLRAAMQATDPARHLLTREEREQQSQKMKQWWRRKKRREARQAQQAQRR